MKKFLVFSVLLASIGYNGFSQFSISGEFRPRGEYRHGYKQMADDTLHIDPAILVSQRTRINLNYKAPQYKVGFSLQDVRCWGDQVPKEDVASLAVYQAWLAYKIYDSLWVKLGRQDIVFDNERLFSNNNWNQNSQAHDALRLTFQKEKIKLDAISSYNSSSDQYFGNDYAYYDKNYKLLNILWISKNFGHIKTQLMGINDGFQKAGTKATIYMRYTHGGGIDIPLKTFLFQGRGYHQSGKTIEGTTINANYFSANLTDTVLKCLIITAGMEWLSGNDALDTTNTQQHAFDPLYGSNHSYQGSLDYFTSIIKNTGGAGLEDFYLKTQFKCCKTTSILLDYHAFLLQNNYVNAGEDKPIDKYLASEIDAMVRFKLAKEATLELGYSYLIPTKSMETVLNKGYTSTINHWAYLMLTVKPNFL
jgi:hypothetical protein